jgi:hypothetical protein
VARPVDVAGDETRTDHIAAILRWCLAELSRPKE